MIVGLIGKAGVGKDTVFQIIYDLWEARFTKVEGKKLEKEYHQQFQNVKFAGKVKEVCSAITGYPIETFYNREKYNYTIPGLTGNITIRTLMQKVGEGLRKCVGDDIWIRAAFSKIKPNSEMVFTDVRYPNELNALLNHKAILIRITRPNHEESTIQGEQSTHSSEIALDNVDHTTYNYQLINDGTLDELKIKVKLIMDELWNQTKD